MDKTYTYTARSARDPARVVTFTLHGDEMSVGSAAPVEQVGRALHRHKEDEPEEQQSAETRLWITPIALATFEQVTHPFHIRDVDARVDDDHLDVKIWIRIAGLRAAPVPLMSGRVDNPEAAQAFARHVEERQKASSHPGKLRWFLDYWATWVVSGLFLTALLGRLRRNHRKAAHAEE